MLRRIIRRRPGLTASIALAAAGALAGLPACAGGRPMEGPFGAERSVARSLPVADLFERPVGEHRFHGLEGAYRGENVIFERSEPDADGRWTLTRRLEGADRPLRVETLTRRDDGAIVMLSSAAYDRDAYTTYEPPLVIMPAALEPGKLFRQQVDLTVHPIDDRDRIRNRGEGAQEIRLGARQRVHAPDRNFDAVRVDARFDIDVSAARVVSETETWLSLDNGRLQGPIAERYQEVMKVLGIPTSRRGHLLIRETPSP